MLTFRKSSEWHLPLFIFAFFIPMHSVSGAAVAEITDAPNKPPAPFRFPPKFSPALALGASEIPAPLIIGGQAAAPFQFPSCGSLQYAWSPGVFNHTCTGSIINANWFMTAGHCAGLGPTSNYRVLLGNNALFASSPTQQLRGVKDIQTHPKLVLTDTDIDYDLAMMMFDSPLDFSNPSIVGPAALVPPGFVTTGSGVAAGWGLTTPNGNAVSPTLQEVSLPVVAWRRCQRQFANVDIDLTARFFCGGGERGHSTCNGDSGGPFYVTLNGNSETVSGLTSWGVTCGSTWPTAFTDVGVLNGYITCVMGFAVPLTPAQNQACGAGERK